MSGRCNISESDILSAHNIKQSELIGYRIRRLNTLLTQHSKGIGSQILGLTLAQSRVLYELGIRGPSKPAQIAASIGLERSHVTQATRSLIQRNLVSKSSDPEDGRGVVLSITASGQALVNRGLEATQERRRRLDEALTPHELRTFDAALAKLTAAAEKLLEEQAHTWPGTSQRT